MASNKQIIEFQGKGIKKLKKQYKELERRTRGLEKSTRGGSSALGGMVAKLGLTTAALYGATKAISGVIKVGAGFEKTMSNVKAISGATGAEMKALEKNAKDLGSTTVFTATQVGELQTEFAKLGFTSKEIQGVTKDTLALAAASGSDLATAAAIAGGTLKAFGMHVSETSRVTDTMALSFSSSALDMEKFTNSMQYVGPIAKAAGIGVEGATAMLGTLANNMISGSMAGTALRKILLEAGKEGSKLADRMGGPVTSMEDFQDGLRKLKKDGLDVMAEGVDLVGARAVTAFGILLDGVDKTDELTESLNNSAGAAQSMADIQLDNLSGKFTLMQSATEGLGISIFDHFVKPLGKAVDGMTAMIGAIDGYMKIPTSEKLKAEQRELNNLATTLQRNIEKEEVRKRLVIELNKKYPDFLKNMDQEKISADDIATALIKTNKQYKEKIKIAVAEDLIAKKLKESSKAFDDQTRAGLLVEDQLNQIAKRTGHAIDTTKSYQDQITDQTKALHDLEKIYAVLDAKVRDTINVTGDQRKQYNKLGREISFIKAHINGATSELKEYTKTEKVGNEALEEHARYVVKLNKILEKFGITQEKVASGAEEPLGKGGKGEKELTELEKYIALQLDKHKALVAEKALKDQFIALHQAEALAMGLITKEQDKQLKFMQTLGDESSKKTKEELVRLATVSEEWAKYLSTKAKAAGFDSIYAALGLPEPDEVGLSLEQIASIQSEFNNRFIEMTKGRHAIELEELKIAGERYLEVVKGDKEKEEQLELWIATRKKNIDVDYLNSKISSVGSLMGAFGELNQASKGHALVSKRLAQGEAAMSTWVAVNKALAAGVPPWNIVQATAIGAMGLANVLKIEAQEFAEGGIVPGSGNRDTVPAMLTPGEVILSQAQQENLVGNMGVTINISAPLVDETVVESIIPAIERARRLNLA